MNVPADIRREYSLCEVEDVTFVQLSATPYRYRDAIRFHNGAERLLQTLAEGVRFEILSLEGGQPEAEDGIVVRPVQVACRSSDRGAGLIDSR
jgi:hypothetical protein